MSAMEKVIRELAYELWEQAGRPDGRSDEFWFAARYEFERREETGETQLGADEGIGVSRTDPTTALSQVIGSSGGPALRAKAKHQEKIPISRDHGRATSLLNSQRSTTGTNSPATPPSSVDERSPQSRKRTIMGRYVFDDELKPGARWKRRLLGMR